MTDRLRFGIFMAPFHPAGENPTLAIERDLQLIDHLDRLGWDEAWIGEHHSAGTEIIASPELFIAAAAERTKHIHLGTGVISVAYHNPFMVAERAVQLDHMTRGRFMLGLGPGSLPTDALMLGLDPTETRPLLEEGVDVIMRLLTSDEPVTSHTKAWTITDARLHLRPYSDPLFEVAVPAVASPSGPRLAGRYGLGLLSIGATQSAGTPSGLQPPGSLLDTSKYRPSVMMNAIPRVIPMTPSVAMNGGSRTSTIKLELRVPAARPTTRAAAMQAGSG